ncbi:MAG: hypothetical protein QOE80_2227 [Actinomycetota bacterium]|nr:hypothetical protein [Actinomycetota bacterium]
MAGDGSGATTTTQTPDATPNPAAVGELPSDFGQAPAPPTTAGADGAPIDAAAPPLSQAGHTGRPKNGAALWATGAAFGGLLLLCSGWLWTRRRRYDPA